MAERCSFEREDGRRCQAWAMAGRGMCFFHDPERAEDLARAQQLGGLRRRREEASATVYGIDGFVGPTDARRVLEIALLDTLALENSIARNRVLGYLSQQLLRAVEIGGEAPARLRRPEDRQPTS